MSAEFVDTNIILYAHDGAAGRRHDRSFELLSRLADEGAGAVSIQILCEFYSAATRKLNMSSQDAEAVVAYFTQWTVHRPAIADLLRAAQLQRKHRMSWWDALILTSAIALGCHTLWTEDLSHGQRFGPLVVRNPFKE